MKKRAYVGFDQNGDIQIGSLQEDEFVPPLSELLVLAAQCVCSVPSSRPQLPEAERRQQEGGEREGLSPVRKSSTNTVYIVVISALVFVVVLLLLVLFYFNFLENQQQP